MKDLTRGNLVQNLIIFAGPMLVTNILSTAYNIVDTIYLGRVGAYAVAAVSMSFAIIFVIISLAIGFTIGTTTLVAQYTGARKYNIVSQVISNSIVFLLILATGLLFLGLLLRGPLLQLLRTPKEILTDARGYLTIVLLGLPAGFAFFSISAILRGLGDSKTPMYFLILSNMLNVILDPLLIFGIGPFPRMEVLGAGIATLTAQIIAALVAVYYLLKKPEPFCLHLKGFRFDWHIIKDITRLGVPAGIGMTIIAVAGTVIISVVAFFGPSVLATFSIGQKLDNLVFMPSMSLAMAATVMVGQNIGAGLRKRVYQTVYVAMGIIAGALGFFTLLFELFPTALIKLFTTDASIFQMGKDYVRIVALSYIPLGVMIVIEGILRGAGAMIAATFISTLTLLILRVPLAIFFSRYLAWGPPGLWWSLSLSNFSGMLIGLIYLFKGHWIEKAVVKISPVPSFIPADEALNSTTAADPSEYKKQEPESGAPN